MIFDNEHTTRGTKRRNKHWFLIKGKEAMNSAFKDMANSDIKYKELFNKEAILKAINQYQNIIYLH